MHDSLYYKAEFKSIFVYNSCVHWKPVELQTAPLADGLASLIVKEKTNPELLYPS